MKIVCLDGHTLNPGDLSWDAVRALGEFELYDYTEPDQTVERAKDADILTNKVIISRFIMDQLPKLKMISVLATGYDIIDIRAASDRNIPVCNVPSYGSYSVARWSSPTSSTSRSVATTPKRSSRDAGCNPKTSAIGTTR